MSRKDLKELGEELDKGQAGLVVVAVSDMQSKVEKAMSKATKIDEKKLDSDGEKLEAEAKEASELGHAAPAAPSAT